MRAERWRVEAGWIGIVAEGVASECPADSRRQSSRGTSTFARGSLRRAEASGPQSKVGRRRDNSVKLFAPAGVQQ